MAEEYRQNRRPPYSGGAQGARSGQYGAHGVDYDDGDRSSVTGDDDDTEGNRVDDDHDSRANVHDADVINVVYSASAANVVPTSRPPPRPQLDSGAVAHTFGAGQLIINDHGPLTNQAIRVANGKLLQAPRHVDTALTLGDGSTFPLRDALVHPDIKASLVSVGALCEDKNIDCVVFRNEGAKVFGTDGQVVMSAPKCLHTGRYEIMQVDGPVDLTVDPDPVRSITSQHGDKATSSVHAIGQSSQPSVDLDTNMWHQRTHMGYTTLQRAAISGALVQGDDILASLKVCSHHCKSCVLCKARRANVAKALRPDSRPPGPLHTVTVDTWVRLPLSRDEERYVSIMVDGYSSYITVAITQTKDVLTAAIIAGLERGKVAAGHPVVYLRADRGSENANNELASWCTKSGTTLMLAPTDVHHLTGKAERAIGTMGNYTRAIMHAAKAPYWLWPHAVRYAVYMYNHCIVQRGHSLTPHQLLHGLTVPISLNELKVWGCDVTMRRLDKHVAHDLQPLAIQGINLGYDPTVLGYQVMDVTGGIHVSRDVTHHEQRFTQMAILVGDGCDSGSVAGGESVAPFLPQGDLALAKLINMQDAAVTAAPPVKQTTVTQHGDRGGLRRSGRTAPPPNRYGMVDPRDVVSSTKILQQGPSSVVANAVERDYDREKCHREATLNHPPRRTDPPVTHGQIQMPTQQCTADNTKGVRCGCRTRFGEFCGKHLPLLQHVRIVKVGEPVNGFGLVAAVDIPANSPILVYNGDLYGNVKHRAPDDMSNFMLAIGKNRVIDAARTNTSVARLINDYRGYGRTYNAIFEISPSDDSVRVVTTRAIPAGEAILTDYGADYWRSMAQRDKMRPSLRTSHTNAVDGPSPGVDLTRTIHPASVGLGDPNSYREVLGRPDCAHWMAARVEEHNNHLANGTYQIVPYDSLPKGTRLLGWREVFKLKVDEAGRPERYKARFALRGDQQTPDQYGDISSSVFLLKSLRILLALVALFDLELKHGDFVAAFLQSKLEELIYAHMPHGIDAPLRSVIKVLMSIYGLKQAGANWQKKLFTKLLSMGYIPLQGTDDCVFIKRLPNGRPLIVYVYVDDLPYAYDKRDTVAMEADINELAACMKLNLLGDATHVLGWRIIRDRAKRTLSVDLQGYIEQTLIKFRMDQCIPCDDPGTPVDLLLGLHTEAPPVTKATVARMLTTTDTHGVDDYYDVTDPDERYSGVHSDNYREAIGCLNWIAQCHLPVQHAVMQLSRFSANPQPQHIKGVKKVLRYLKGARTQKLTYSANAKGYGDTPPNRIVAMSDSNWGGDPSDSRSTSGYVIMLAGAAISVGCKRQSIVADSTMTAETIAGITLCKELVWIQAMLTALDCPQPSPITMWVDNTSAIVAANGKGNADRQKIIRIRYHQLADEVSTGFVTLQHVPSANNLADIYTKVLPKATFVDLAKAIMGGNQ